VVVKNQPFLIQVGLLNTVFVEGQAVDFTRFPIEARLLYDADNLKEVDFVKLKPMDVKPHVNDRGDQVTAEIRIKVLTSQLEDMLFRVRLCAIHPITKARIEQLCVVSEPIKVVSKPEQVKKKKDPAVQQAKAKEKSITKQIDIPKRDVNEILAETLQKIEATCAHHKQMLAQVMENTQTSHTSILQLLSLEPETSASLFGGDSFSKDGGKKRKDRDDDSRAETPFEISFKQFMQAYNKLSHEERPGKVRRVMNQTPTRDGEAFIEMLERCQTEAREAPREKRAMKSFDQANACLCEDCPHRRELERIDDFYNEFLSTPQVLPIPL